MVLGGPLLLARQDAGLLDIAGLRVMSLQPGVNDIRHVAPGVYFFVRTEGSVRVRHVVAAQ